LKKKKTQLSLTSNQNKQNPLEVLIHQA